MAVKCQLAFLEVAVAYSHDPEGAAGDLLIEKKHEGSSQHGLQELGLQAFKQTQHAILPKRKKTWLKHTMFNMNMHYCLPERTKANIRAL